MYRPAGSTYENSKTARAEIFGIHPALPVMLVFLLGETRSLHCGEHCARSNALLRAWKMHVAAPNLGVQIMRLSSNLVAPSAVAILSTSLLCGLSGTTAAQTTPSSLLPGVTVTAPEQKARPSQRQERAAGTGAVFRRGPAGRTTSQTAGGTPPGPVMAKLARLEREAHSCNDGCESSSPRGKDPWVGCSESTGWNSVFSATCKDTLTHRDYVQCVETKMFLGWNHQRSWWYCNGMLNGGKFRVTVENRNR